MIRPPSMADLVRKAYLDLDHLNGRSLWGCLLLRHAARQPIESWADIETADLTDLGRQQAYAAGQALARRAVIRQIVTSPTPRCVHTAEEISRGYHKFHSGAAPVVVVPALHYNTRTWNLPDLPQVVIEDQALAAMFVSLEQSERRQLALGLLSQVPCNRPGELVVAVTHDTVVAMVAGVLLGATGVTIADGPGFLQGILIQPAAPGSPLPYQVIPATPSGTNDEINRTEEML